jgi:hypothetical protein
MLLKSWGAALALSLAFMSGVVQAQVVLPGGVTTPGGQSVGVVPMAIINPNDGATCIVGNSGCPSIGGGGGSGGAVTAAANSYATGFSPDIGTLVSPDPNSLLGQMTTSLTKLGQIVTAAQAPLAAQTSAGVKIGAIEGVSASGATYSENPLPGGCRAATAIPTAVTNGQKIETQCTKTGKTVTSPYAIDDVWTNGSASSTDTSAHQLIAAAAAGVKNYVTGLQCTNSSATDSDITLNNSTSWSTTLKAGAGTNVVFATPISTAAATALNFTMGTGVSTVKCNAQGYQAP